MSLGYPRCVVGCDRGGLDHVGRGRGGRIGWTAMIVAYATTLSRSSLGDGG